MTIKNDRLVILKGETCPFCSVCKWPCVAKCNMEINFSCGIYKEYITIEYR